MLAKKILDDIAAKLSDTLAQSPAKDVEKNIKALLGSAFSRMDLVTREEFDIQEQVLVRTREQLAALEKRLAELENHKDAPHASGSFTQTMTAPAGHNAAASEPLAQASGAVSVSGALTGQTAAQASGLSGSGDSDAAIRTAPDAP